MLSCTIAAAATGKLCGFGTFVDFTHAVDEQRPDGSDAFEVTFTHSVSSFWDRSGFVGSGLGERVASAA